jgi:phosphatidate phosphatase APP1
MSDWSEELGFLLRKVGKTAELAARAVGSAFDDDPHEIICYRGYGNADRAWVYGRVVERRNIGVSKDTDSTLLNLLNTYRRADSDPLGFARVSVEYAGRKVELEADDEGYFGEWIEPGDPSALADGKEWQEYNALLEAATSRATDPIKGSGEVMSLAPTARFGVISDIDDTVIQSRVSSFLQAARTVMLGNARTRLPFPGVAAFYRALRDGVEGKDSNPIFYVSSSPWNIYDVIGEFMDLQNIPKGPLLLRDWDISLGALSSSHHFGHKGVAIRNILNLFPGLPFILIGDSSQHDPEIYRQIVGEFPGRVAAVYIRDVTRSIERSSSVNKLADEIMAAESTLILSEDTLGAARHAAEQGWISDKTLPDIGEEKKADEGTDGRKVASPGGGEQGSGQPATVVGQTPPGAVSGATPAVVPPQSTQE